MALFDRISHFFALTPWQDPDPIPGPLQTREVDNGSLADFIARIEGGRSQPWRTATTTEALGVPAIFSAITLIANATGSLSLKGFRQGKELSDADRPRLIIRPNPFTTPHDFFRDTAYSMAVYGEAWWWIAARDFDDLPLSLIPVNPAEIIVTEDPNDLRYPVIEWRGKRMANKDMRQITFLKEPGALRGFGPLQKCGAAVSVAVEAQEWAANFYAEGGKGGTTIHMEYEPGADPDDAGLNEADRLRAQWVARAHNSVRIVGPSISNIDEHEPNEAGAQMLQSRGYSAVEAAQMFNMPAPMLEAGVAGSSLTYQSIPNLFDSFARRCLTPNYLEPIEQTMSDLLNRQTIVRFNLDALLRADIKTRFEVYGLGIDKGIYTPELAQAKEGIAPGDVEFAPVPLSAPQAVPASLPTQGRVAQGGEVRCPKGHLLAEFAAPPYRFTCPKSNCRAVVQADAEVEVRTEAPDTGIRDLMQSSADLADRVITSVGEMARQSLNQPVPVINVEAPVVHLPAPVVNVEAAPPANVVVDSAAFAFALDELSRRFDLANKPRRREVERDAAGRIVALTEWADVEEKAS